MSDIILEAICRRGADVVLTDSRSLREPARTVFFALRTANNDGHKYIAELAAQGVGLFVVEEIPDGVD
ncbi:MAG: hypothetical protein K2L33_07190, partial [Muribaculaceae bacterium]|nr:hypothetical protein [Muribaculaceae bacterium]